MCHDLLSYSEKHCGMYEYLLIYYITIIFNMAVIQIIHEQNLIRRYTQ